VTLSSGACSFALEASAAEIDTIEVLSSVSLTVKFPSAFGTAATAAPTS
jgi:hypothetical protein